jgi:hypothetical protein
MRHALLAALLLIAACDSGHADAPPTKNDAVPAADYQNRIAGMTEAARNAVFVRTIRDADQDCQNVLTSAASTAPGAPIWLATCEDGRHWAITIGPGGVASVSPGRPEAQPQ